MTAITVHGATVTVTGDGVRVERTAMGQTLLPAELHFTAQDLRGWYHHAPTATSPGWIQFSLARPDEVPDAVSRPVRGYPATHGVTNIVAFAPGQQDAFVAANAALTALQGGYPVDGGTDLDGAGDATDGSTGGEGSDATPGDSPLSLFELPGQEEPATSGTGAPGQSGSDGKGGRGGRSSGRDSWKRVSTPDVLPEPDLSADADGPVFGQNVTVTGDFEPYEKGEVWDMIAAAGGTVGKNVTKKTTVLILGEWGSVTSKEKRARELKEKGQDIQLWTFDEFLEKVGRTRRPEFSEVKETDAPF